MSEMGNLKSFLGYLNQIYPGGSLYLLLSDKEFKQLFMEKTNSFLASNTNQCSAARIVGINVNSDGERIWVLSEKVQMNESGEIVDSTQSHVQWLKQPDSIHRTSNMLIYESLKCSVAMPPDNGEALVNLCQKIKQFMPDNFMPTIASMAAFVMGTCYVDLVKRWGEVGVPFLFGAAGSCKSEALKCAAALFGTELTHIMNSQTTPSFLFDIMQQTTITIIIDDLNKKCQDNWEEIIVDASNNTPRGTRSYSVERFQTIPMFSANWRFPVTNERAQTRTITIPFVVHNNDEPEACAHHMELVAARLNASCSVGVIIQLLCSNTVELCVTSELTSKVMACLGNGKCNTRLTTTMTVFMHFFLKVSYQLFTII